MPLETSTSRDLLNRLCDNAKALGWNIYDMTIEGKEIQLLIRPTEDDGKSVRDRDSQRNSAQRANLPSKGGESTTSSSYMDPV